MESLSEELDVAPASGAARARSPEGVQAPLGSSAEHGRAASRVGVATCASSVVTTAGLIFAMSAQPPKHWMFEYFPNAQLAGAAVEAMIGTPDFELSTTFSPGPAEGSTRIAETRKRDSDFPRGLPDRESFSLRMRSCVEVPASGVYRIAVNADDGLRLFVDDELQIDAWGRDAMTGVVKALQLDGGLHSMTIEYVNAKGAARLAVRMSGTDPFQPPHSFQDRTTPMGDGGTCGRR
jgi:hypothetical protein